jgi:stress response protein YsnF
MVQFSKPDMLYVMNFISSAPSDSDDEEQCENDEVTSEDVKTESPEIRKSNFKTSENRISKSSKIEL